MCRKSNKHWLASACTVVTAMLHPSLAEEVWPAGLVPAHHTTERKNVNSHDVPIKNFSWFPTSGLVPGKGIHSTSFGQQGTFNFSLL